MAEKEFKVNDYITLKLEDGQTIIYVNDERFNQCKYLAFQININEVSDYDDIQSIDMMEQRDRSQVFENLNIPPEEEFWGHCSNIQAWVENDYNTKLLHRNIAFPLLKKLTEVGDPVAKNVFKEEIIYRLEEGNFNVMRYLLKRGYLKNFSREEIEILYNSINFQTVKLLLFGFQNEAPQSFYDNLDKVSENIELVKWAVKNKASSNFYKNLDKMNENIELAKWAIKNKASDFFYKNFDKVSKNIKLAQWAVKKDVPWFFYEYFDQLDENIYLAKWGIQNDATAGFYKYFHQVNKNVDLAKRGVENNASSYFYRYFSQIKGNVYLYEWGLQNEAPYQFFKNFSTIYKDPSSINSFKVSKKLKEKYLNEFPREI